MYQTTERKLFQFWVQISSKLGGQHAGHTSPKRKYLIVKIQRCLYSYSRPHCYLTLLLLKYLCFSNLPLYTSISLHQNFIIYFSLQGSYCLYSPLLPLLCASCLRQTVFLFGSSSQRLLILYLYQDSHSNPVGK